MTEVKIPEPCNTALCENYQGQSEYRLLSYEYCDMTGKYSEKQLKAYGDDRAIEALEKAAKVCDKANGTEYPADLAIKIKALK